MGFTEFYRFFFGAWKGLNLGFFRWVWILSLRYWVSARLARGHGKVSGSLSICCCCCCCCCCWCCCCCCCCLIYWRVRRAIILFAVTGARRDWTIGGGANFGFFFSFLFLFLNIFFLIFFRVLRRSETFAASGDARSRRTDENKNRNKNKNEIK